MTSVLCLGWNGGGWHGRKDGLAALLLSPEGDLESSGQARTCALGDVIGRGALTVEYLAERAGAGLAWGRPGRDASLTPKRPPAMAGYDVL